MSSQGIELRDMSSQGIELREKTQQAKSEKDHVVVIDPKPRKLRGLSHRRSFATTFTQNLLREIDRNIYKEEALRKRLLPGTLQNVTNTKAKDAEAKDADGDWEFVEKLEKEEEEDDFVVVPAGNIRKTKTYTSNLAEAGKGTGK